MVAMQPNFQSRNRNVLLQLLPDVFFILGLGSLGYGLYQFAPWVAFVVVGGILMGVGLLMGRNT